MVKTRKAASKGKSSGYTDENAEWLKLKQKKQDLPLDDESSIDSNDNNSEDEEEENSSVDASSNSNTNSDDDDDSSSNEKEEELEIERQARELDEQQEQELKDAEEDYQHTIKHQTATYHLESDESVESSDEDNNEHKISRVEAPSEIRERIEDIIGVLSDFKNNREEGKSRTDYLTRLQYDMAEFFGYLPELIELFLSMFNPTECLEFLDASDTPRPLVIRTNTLKVRRKDLAQALMKRGVNLDPLASWSKVGLKIAESPVPVGATPEYLSGYYMLQSAASMCPVMALAPQPGEKVMDMASAPGGKTSYLAQLMKNTGTILANDLKLERQKATMANLHRLGVRNTVVCTHDGRKLAKLASTFDRILLDAPCSGLGVISRDQSVKIQRTVKDIQRTAHLQKELLLAGIDALNHKSKTGGYIVYSTCSVSVQENEEVVNYVLGKRDVKLVDTGLDFGKPGYTRYQHKRFHPSVALTRRFYPHVHNMDGFYVAKFQKLSNKYSSNIVETNTNSKEEEDDDENVDDEATESEEVVEEQEQTKKSKKKKVTTDEDEEPSSEKKDKKAQKKPDRKKKRDKSDDIARIPKPPAKKKKTNAKVTKPRRMKKSEQER